MPCVRGGGVAPSDEDNAYRVPDLLVSCVPPCRHHVDRQHPIAEVLSASTEKDDRTAKLDVDHSLPTVAVILLVWQDARRVEIHTRHGEVWEVCTVIGSATVPLKPFDAFLPLDEIYDEAGSET